MEKERKPMELEDLFASYRRAVPEVDASANFMPGLWAKVEQRQRVTYSIGRLASGFVTAAAAICLILSAVLSSPSQVPTLYSSTYVDILADDTAIRGDLEQNESQ